MFIPVQHIDPTEFWHIALHVPLVCVAGSYIGILESHVLLQVDFLKWVVVQTGQTVPITESFDWVICTFDILLQHKSAEFKACN